MMEIAVRAESLVKRFGDFTAVDRVSFEVEKGEIYGFLGPNGAGKSTTIRMLCGLLNPTEGNATVSGFDLKKQPDRIKEHIGYMSQKFSLYDDLTVVQNINFYAGIYDLPRAKKKEKKGWALEISGLVGKENMLTSNLSGGWKQRLSLACSILHDPGIVFLDEPTAGVDPISRRDFWDLIYDMSAEGVTVFVTTHFMDEAEHCDRLVMIYAGQKIAEGTPASFKEEILKGDLLEVRCQKPLDALPLLEKLPGVKRASIFGDGLHLLCEDEATVRSRLKEELGGIGLALTSADVVDKSLEDAFLEAIALHDAKKKGSAA